MTPEELIAELEREKEAAEVEDARVKKAQLLGRVVHQFRAALQTAGVAPPTENDDVIDAKAVATLLGWKNHRTVWDHSHDYPFAWKEGGRWKYSRSGVLRWIRQQQAA